MVTVAEKQADFGTLIDDIAGMLDSLTAWSDADTDITNSGSDGSWQNNGRVYFNSNMNIYVLFYIINTNDDPSGLRFHISDDWDDTNSLPMGRSNHDGKDAFNLSSGTNRGGSFNNYSQESEEHNLLALQTKKGGTSNIDRTTVLSYFLSASDDHLNAAAWDNSDTTDGGPGVISIETVTNKLWSDGNDPWCAYYACAYGNGNQRRSAGMYGWSHYRAYGSSYDINTPYKHPGFKKSKWGRVNADSGDDTFFFAKPVVFQTHAEKVPVAYLDGIMRNDPTEGASHGDTITYNGDTYKAMKENGGAGASTLHSLLLYQ